MTQNRHKTLPLLLTSLLGQTYKNWDLFIIENDDPKNHLKNNHIIMDILYELLKHGHKIFITRGIESKGWEGLTLNQEAYLKMTPHEININCHDHNILFPNTIEKLIEPHLKLENVGMTGGIIHNIGLNNIMQRDSYDKFLDDAEKEFKNEDCDFISFWFTVQRSEWGKVTEDFIGAETLNGGLISFKKSAVIKAGGFCVEENGIYSIHEDTDTSLRVKLAGYDNYICKNAHHVEYDVKKLKGSFYDDEKCGIDPYEQKEFMDGHILSNKRFKKMYKQDKTLMKGRKLKLLATR